MFQKFSAHPQPPPPKTKEFQKREKENLQSV